MVYIPGRKQMNPMWDLSQPTPNERFWGDENYLKAVNMWMKANSVPGKPRWKEVRIIRGKPSVEVEQPWWAEADFMDTIFWVFERPLTTHPDGKRFYQYYFLEPYEAARVCMTLKDKLGFNPFGNDFAVVLLPCECAQSTTRDTVGGIPLIKRWRPEKIKTQWEKEQEQMVQENLKNVIDMKDAKWLQSPPKKSSRNSQRA